MTAEELKALSDAELAQQIADNQRIVKAGMRPSIVDYDVADRMLKLLNKEAIQRWLYEQGVK